jgi:hypothetical protein
MTPHPPTPEAAASADPATQPPATPAGDRAAAQEAERAADALDNVREGYGALPPAVDPAGRADDRSPAAPT